MPEPADPLSTLSERVDYLQGTWAGVDGVTAAQTCTAAAPQARRLSSIGGISTLDKETTSRAESQPRWETEQKGQRAAQWLPTSVDLLVGLHARTALAYQVSELDGHLRIRAGVWSSRPDAGDLDLRQEMLLSLLRSCYVEVRDEPASGPLGDASHGGYVLGVPHPRAPRAADPAGPWDRLLRGLSGERWAVVVLAQPIQDAARVRLRQQLLTESRLIEAVQGKDRPQHPLAQSYLESLKASVEALTVAGAVGAWRTAVYLLGDATGYQRLSAAWKGLFTGSDGRDMPVLVHAAPAVPELAAGWSLPDTPAPESPGSVRFPFAAQTVLTSHQLAAYVHLPEQEHPGYSVEQVAMFDSSPKGVQAARPPADQGEKAREIRFGKVIDRTRVTDTYYTLAPESLTKHAFVCGVTRSGKTNTILTMLEAAAQESANFLVLEPAKKEYRSLLQVPHLSKHLRVFTAGDETVAPLRINPLEVPRKIAVATHLDLIRSLFAGAFAMWSPLPQIVEQALYRAYRDRGWDVTSNTNARLGGASDRESFPTLSDLADRVEDVIRETGYDPEATGRIRGALSTALGGLRAGGKGRMFDAGWAIDAAELFDRPVVIELEPLGDENDKAFLMGLILIRLAEHRRAQGPHEGLRHLLVVEEAHRLLSSKGRRGDRDQSGDAGEQAIETFTNLLAEVAAYGQGLVIADQVPSRLAPEVLKNTNLKIVHRIVAEDDRKAVGETMVMTPLQSRALATLTQGDAAVFAEGEDAPLLIHVLQAQANDSRTGEGLPVDDDAVRANARSAGEDRLKEADCCGRGDPAACQRGREAATSAHLRSIVRQVAVTLARIPTVGIRLWPDLRIEIEEALAPGLAVDGADPAWRCVLWHGASELAHRRGAQRGWTYADTREYLEALYEALASCADGNGDPATPASARFAELSLRLYHRARDPFPRCQDICPDQTCIYRWPASDALDDPEVAAPLQATISSAGEGLAGAAEALADWIAASPTASWTEAEADQGRRAHRAATQCVAQLAVARYKPWPSSSQHIDVALQAVALTEHAPADA
jgi:DNA helicase HerA-like ATPase